MRKPSPKKTTSRKPAPKRVVAPVPLAPDVQETAPVVIATEGTTEVLPVQESPADVQPAVAETPAPVEKPADDEFDPSLDGGEDADVIFGDETQDPPLPETVDDPVVQPAPPPVPPVPSASYEMVRIGDVEGVLACVPIAVVQAVVGPDTAKRAAALNTAAVSDLQTQMRATDARCAPMIFTRSGEGETTAVHLFAGLESLAAAMRLGLEHLYVITIASDDARRAQSLLGDLRRRPQTSADDDLLRQVHAFYEQA